MHDVEKGVSVKTGLAGRVRVIYETLGRSGSLENSRRGRRTKGAANCNYPIFTIGIMDPQHGKTRTDVLRVPEAVDYPSRREVARSHFPEKEFGYPIVPACYWCSVFLGRRPSPPTGHLVPFAGLECPGASESNRRVISRPLSWDECGY